MTWDEIVLAKDVYHIRQWEESMSDSKCPYCLELINPEAKKCKHCGEFLLPTKRNGGSFLEFYRVTIDAFDKSCSTYRNLGRRRDLSPDHRRSSASCRGIRCHGKQGQVHKSLGISLIRSRQDGKVSEQPVSDDRQGYFHPNPQCIVCAPKSAPYFFILLHGSEDRWRYPLRARISKG